MSLLPTFLPPKTIEEQVDILEDRINKLECIVLNIRARQNGTSVISEELKFRLGEEDYYKDDKGCDIAWVNKNERNFLVPSEDKVESNDNNPDKGTDCN